VDGSAKAVKGAELGKSRYVSTTPVSKRIRPLLGRSQSELMTDHSH
jgi:hypothetical protein